MEAHQIIVANEQRLLRDMLERIFRKTPDFEAIVTRDNPDHISHLLERTEAEWVIISLNGNGTMPSYVETLLEEHPKTRFLGMTADGSELKMKWVVPHKARLEDLSLSDLLDALRERAPWEIKMEPQV